MCLYFFFFNDTATTEIYTLSLHDALPIYARGVPTARARRGLRLPADAAAHLRDGVPPLQQRRDLRRDDDEDSPGGLPHQDRKSTRLNSSHANISYAVFCLKKKKIIYFYLH